MSNSIKLSCLSCDILSTEGVVNFTEGYSFLGDEHLSLPSEEPQTLPYKSYTGTSETKGNESRSFYDLNTNGPVRYGPTGDDNKQILQKYTNVVSTNPILSSYPYINPQSYLESWTSNTQAVVNLSQNGLPIYKCLGKGLGEVSMFRTGSSFDGYGNTSLDYVDPKNEFTYQNKNYSFDSVYPYNGKIYAGTLVQLKTEIAENGIKRTVVVPYQAGRGIPQNIKNYYFGEGIDKDTPWGNLVYPTTEDTLYPALSKGIEPGNNVTCVGIVLDSYSTTIPNQRIFISRPPENLPNVQHDKWYNHPAPQTIPATSYKENRTQGFLSPGPNLSGTFWSPWPEFYAYKSSDPIPVITRGITTARIGAAYNISLITYGIKQVVSSTNSVWVPVQCIPLFQGERIEAGSTIYASVKGNVVTPGASVFEADLPLCKGGNLGQTPWDLFVDSTWGNVGWTGTPGFSFSCLPDSEVAIAQTLPDKDGLSLNIPYLNQSNQGSIIIQAVTNVSPEPALGNAYLSIVGDANQSFSDLEAYNIRKERFALPGVSGRCMLVQSSPEKSQPIGVLLETIVGTGKWPYTGLPLEFFSIFPELTPNGAVYVDPSAAVSFSTRGGTGAGMTVEWTTQLTEYPYLGTLVADPTIVAPGVGYTYGDIITIKDNSITYNPLGPQYKGNNASYIYDDVLGTLVATVGGFGYTQFASSIVQTHNLSRNCLYIYYSGNNTLSRSGATPVISSILYFQDYTKYPPGTLITMLEEGLFSQALAVDEIVEVSNILTSTTSVYAGVGYANSGGDVVYETNVINYNFANPIVTYTRVNNQNIILSINILDYGHGNLEGDIIVVARINNNATFSFPGLPPGQQQITHGSSQYDSTVGPFSLLSPVDADSVLLTSTVEIYNDPIRQSENGELFAVGVNLTNFTAVPATPTYACVVYTGGYQMASPWYHGRNFTLLLDNAVDQYAKVVRGGTGYTVNSKLKCYNLTANSLRLRYTVTDGKITAKVAGDPVSDSFQFVEDRYTFGVSNGTQFRILEDETLENDQQVERLITNGGNITTSMVKEGGLYNLANGDYFFQTQRLDQEGPEVSITINPNTGSIFTVVLNDPGVGNQEGDLMLVLQTGSNFNGFFIYNDNRAYLNLPPFAYSKGYKVDNSEAAWNKYSDVMQSATNLMDKQVLIELSPSDSNSMENIYPNAQAASYFMPCTNNPYEIYY